MNEPPYRKNHSAGRDSSCSLLRQVCMSVVGSGGPSFSAILLPKRWMLGYSATGPAVGYVPAMAVWVWSFSCISEPPASCYPILQDATKATEGLTSFTFPATGRHNQEISISTSRPPPYTWSRSSLRHFRRPRQKSTRWLLSHALCSVVWS